VLVELEGHGRERRSPMAWISLAHRGLVHPRVSIRGPRACATGGGRPGGGQGAQAKSNCARYPITA
jgi:hypothetical protein